MAKLLFDPRTHTSSIFQRNREIAQHKPQDLLGTPSGFDITPKTPR